MKTCKRYKQFQLGRGYYSNENDNLLLNSPNASIFAPDKFDFENPEHMEIKRLIEIGDALPDIRTVKKTLEVVKEVGFEILETEDRGETTAINDVPWYRIIDQGFINMKNFKVTSFLKLTSR